MGGRKGRGALAAALVLAAAAAGCARKDIDAATEVPGAVRWFAGVSVEQILPVVQEILTAGGYPAATLDTETGRLESEWGPEFPGGLRGWRLTRWVERQKFIAIVSRSQLQTDKGEPLINVLLRLRWEERPPGGEWRVKEEGGAPSQSPGFQRFVRELDDRAAKLGARRN